MANVGNWTSKGHIGQIHCYVCKKNTLDLLFDFAAEILQCCLTFQLTLMLHHGRIQARPLSGGKYERLACNGPSKICNSGYVRKQLQKTQGRLGMWVVPLSTIQLIE